MRQERSLRPRWASPELIRPRQVPLNRWHKWRGTGSRILCGCLFCSARFYDVRTIGVEEADAFDRMLRRDTYDQAGRQPGALLA